MCHFLKKSLGRHGKELRGSVNVEDKRIVTSIHRVVKSWYGRIEAS